MAKEEGKTSDINTGTQVQDLALCKVVDLNFRSVHMKSEPSGGQTDTQDSEGFIAVCSSIERCWTSSD